MKNVLETGAYEKATEAYFRKLPWKWICAIFAGLERIVRYIEQLLLQKRILTIYVDLGHPEEFLTYLENFSNSKEAFVQSSRRGTRFRERNLLCK